MHINNNNYNKYNNYKQKVKHTKKDVRSPYYRLERFFPDIY